MISEEKKETYCSRNSGGGFIMIWEGISADGMTRIDSIDTIMNATKHVTVFYIFYVDSQMFREECSGAHRRSIVRDWFGNVNVYVLELLSISSDLNRIENIWDGFKANGLFKREVISHC